MRTELETKAIYFLCLAIDRIREGEYELAKHNIDCAINCLVKAQLKKEEK